ncbi:hypothetical protein DFAR_3290016 [Desulfarculales bacterium]
MDLCGVKAVALDETASKRGHNYVIVFIDLDRKQKPVIFVPHGKGKSCLALFRHFLFKHGGDYNNIAEVAATCHKPPWPPSAKNFPAPTSPWTDSM